MRAKGTAPVVLLVCALAGCLRSGMSTCDDGRVCPAGTTCVKLIEGTGDPHRCVEADQLGCVGAESHASCDGGVCYASENGGVCLPAGCANWLIDTNEQCDDGNNLPGDGCSADCASDETCGNGVVDPIGSEQCDDSNTLSHDRCSGLCESELPRWEGTAWRLGTKGGTAMAYDIARRRIVLFGGATFFANDPEPDGASALTFEWDGSSWIQRFPGVTPSSRYAHALAYDGARHKIVMFGGREVGDLNDTWEWNGDTWRSVDTLPPPRRAFHAMVYDAKRKRVVLFGGERNGIELDDTWEFDGAAWTEITAAMRPAARSRHVMAFDPVRGVVVLAGGTQTSDTWEYDGTWRQTQAQFPLESSAAAFDSVTGRIVAFGGRTRANAVVDQTRSYDGQQWSVVVAATSPTGRERHAIAADPIAGGVVVSPGLDLTAASVARTGTWRWNGVTWQSIDSAVPPPRVSSSAAFDPVHRRAVMFGGFDSTNIGDTWLLDRESWRAVPAQPVGQEPSPRSGHTMAFDTTRNQAVLFGGYTGTADSNETWLWNGSWTRATPAMSPVARSSAAAVFDSARSRVVLFGGNASSTRFNDTWEWDGTNWTLVASSGPPALDRPALGYDPIRRRTVLFGGGGTSISETWEWDGVAWMQLSPTIAPPPTSNATFAWDAARGALVVYGGRSTAGFIRDSVWEWNGARWREIEVEGSLPREGYTGFTHPSGAGVAFVGGAPPMTELLHLTYSSRTASYESCADTTDLDGDGFGGCADADCWFVCTPLCPPGVTCDPAAPRCGDGSCNAALENCRLCPGDCGACTPVCGDLACDPNETVAGCPGDCTP